MAKKKEEAEPTPAPAGNGNGGDKKKPVFSLRCSSDRNTSVEVAIWSNTIQYKEGGEGEALAVTVSRSYRDDDGVWRESKGFRTHDLPVLMHLLTRAYGFCLDRRIDQPDD